MAWGLKSQNLPTLAAVLGVNIAVFAVLTSTNRLSFPSWHGDWADLVSKTAPGSLSFILAAVLTHQMESVPKARLVYLKWRNPLPGSEAFTRYAVDDPRVNLDVLRVELGDLPTDPRAQNAQWYRLYREVRDDTTVSHAHKSYLLYRDWLVMSLILAVTLGPIAALTVRSAEASLAYALLLLCQCVVVRRAAVTAGRAMVRNVLAISSHPSGRGAPAIDPITTAGNSS